MRSHRRGIDKDEDHGVGSTIIHELLSVSSQGSVLCWFPKFSHSSEVLGQHYPASGFYLIEGHRNCIQRFEQPEFRAPPMLTNLCYNQSITQHLTKITSIYFTGPFFCCNALPFPLHKHEPQSLREAGICDA